jgi:hypothetical protein
MPCTCIFNRYGNEKKQVGRVLLMSYDGVTSLAKGVLEAECDATQQGEKLPPTWVKECSLLMFFYCTLQQYSSLHYTATYYSTVVSDVYYTAL